MNYSKTGFSKAMHSYFENEGQGTAKELYKHFSPMFPTIKLLHIYPNMFLFKKYYNRRGQSFGMFKPNGSDGVYKLLTTEEATVATARNLKHIQDVTAVNLRATDVAVENDWDSREIVFGKLNQSVKLLSQYLEKWSQPRLKGKE